MDPLKMDDFPTNSQREQPPVLGEFKSHCHLRLPEVKIPSGYVKIAIENGHRNSGFSHQK